MPGTMTPRPYRLLSYTLLAVALASGCESGPLGAALRQRASDREPNGALGEPLSERALSGRVLTVLDGDTLDVDVAGRRTRVRLHGIDAPELGQAWGPQARDFARERAEGGVVTVHPVDTDRYGRLVARVTLEDGSSLGEAIVAAGHAWHFRRYSSSQRLASLEADARSRRLGLWRSPTPTPPWRFRDEARGRDPRADDNR